MMDQIDLGAFELGKRDGLPDALLVLLEEYPHEIWAEHPGFDGLVRFWLDRHLMFRQLLGLLTSEAEKRLDKKTDPMLFKAHVARLGSTLVGELHGHHGIEDAHYFPVLARKDPRITRGFDILDRDHHTLDDLLSRYVEAANRAIQADPGSTREIGRFLEETRGLEAMLSRHLIDEEELVVPIILKHGAGGLS
ncbi:hemerythrin domain-containing protein [Tropicimonas sediminicola]|uniref:Hemerythrin HHE cation binding domain-containing protein n=1 Tax=Tropicimonas sediminicola TaxID=1031541 RepID=A0A239HZY3_9RHOB|nr:hemerythrin domain-containing protein [Tropicimonas sediminicola]SNS87086.1 Hemerythrin HHE cation binding domain-containing protein [Tropicimonas sediminicola]